MALFTSMALVLMLLQQPALAYRSALAASSTTSNRFMNNDRRTASSTATIIEHPVFFNMEDLLENPVNESSILQGLNDLLYNNHSHLYFLYCGRVVESKGVAFTHALMSRFPSVEALEEYYDLAIPDIVVEMWPWLKKEYCVDYAVEMEEDERALNITNDFASHVTFIKASSNVSDSDLKSAMDAFLGLAAETDYAVQMTTGENLYVLEIYRTMSHAFTAYFSSADAMENWQADPAVVSVLQDTILPLAESYAQLLLSCFVWLTAAITNQNNAFEKQWKNWLSCFWSKASCKHNALSCNALYHFPSNLDLVFLHRLPSHEKGFPGSIVT
ncbi:hypothetical protein GOP47_0000081 [Adiantum capillus-veneris]|uniref:Stress-response A/B barrel domain-containing protein n=1 Tax=Adiantum capillus-veneris TaxID=13818 RepID=A0A9D4VCW5_ADICA|nr:hypothetical protein GOP47_0000081 [Adiantum capillus-veneris]